jgi:predicted helicase
MWMWEDFPGRKDFGGADTGIDLVALTKKDDYWAVQCRCFKEDTYLGKPAVDSFPATSGRTFQNDALETARFAQRLWISTADKRSGNAEEAIRNQTPPVSRIDLTQLKDTCQWTGKTR